MRGPLAPDEVAVLIAAGEDSFTEFKDPRVTTGEVATEMCALSNAAGGQVLIGVGDDGALLGPGDWDEERVMNVSRTSIHPPIIPSVQSVILDDGPAVLVVGVEMGDEKPYAVRSGERLRFYVRVGSTTREPSREEHIRLTQASGAVAPDLRPVLGASEDDLEPDLLRQRFAGLRFLDFDALGAAARRRVLIDAEILHEPSGRPTVGGLLCFGAQPQRRLPHAALTCVAYPGRTQGREMLDRSDAAGRVDEQIEAAAAFVDRNLRQASHVAGLRRHDDPLPSRESIREVLANAVAHRQYAIDGPCQVRVFADHLEVLSPGSPPNGVTPASMRLGVSVRRNQFIAQHLTSLGLVDMVGLGVVSLYQEAADLGLPAPVVEVEEGWTRVALRFSATES